MILPGFSRGFVYGIRKNHFLPKREKQVKINSIVQTKTIFVELLIQKFP